MTLKLFADGKINRHTITTAIYAGQAVGLSHAWLAAHVELL